MADFVLAPVGHSGIDSALSECARGLNEAADLLGVDGASLASPGDHSINTQGMSDAADKVRDAVESASTTVSGKSSEWVKDVTKAQHPLLEAASKLSGRDELGALPTVSKDASSAIQDSRHTLSDVAHQYQETRDKLARRVLAIKAMTAVMPAAKIAEALAGLGKPSPDPRVGEAVTKARNAVTAASKRAEKVGNVAIDKPKGLGKTILSAAKNLKDKALPKPMDMANTVGRATGVLSSAPGAAVGGAVSSALRSGGGAALVGGLGSRASRRRGGGMSDSSGTASSDGNGLKDLLKRSAGSGSEKDILKLAAKYADASIPYAWGGGHGAEPGITQGQTDGGGAADQNGDYAKQGLDCSGLVRDFYYQLTGKDIGATTSETQRNMGDGVSAQEAQAGDIWSPSPGHIGIYLGDGQILEAQQSGTNIHIRDLSDSEMSSSVFRRML